MKEILKEIDAKKKIVDLAKELIAQNTVNPPGNECRVARIVEREFKKNKIKYKKFEKKKGRTTIVGYIGQGKKRLLIGCHSDVVPAGNGWNSNPFKAMIKNGRIYGRGATDNKGQIAASLVIAEVLKKRESELKGQFILAIAADEEAGSNLGMKWLLKNKLIKADYAIIPDIEGDLRKIDVAEKGLLFLKITAYGKQVHGSTPEKGINAVWGMIEFLNLLKKHKFKFKKHLLLNNPTFNLGMISGGAAPNIVPAKCSVQLDFRYLPNQTKEQIVLDVKKLIKKINKVKFKLEIIEHQGSAEINKDNVLVKLIKKRTKKITGKLPKTSGCSGTTFTKLFIQNRIIAVGFGPGSETAHMANEYVKIKNLVDFSKIMGLVALDMLGW